MSLLSLLLLTYLPRNQPHWKSPLDLVCNYEPNKYLPIIKTLMNRQLNEYMRKLKYEWMNGSWKLRGKTTSKGAGPGHKQEEERMERRSVLWAWPSHDLCACQVECSAVLLPSHSHYCRSSARSFLMGSFTDAIKQHLWPKSSCFGKLCA